MKPKVRARAISRRKVSGFDVERERLAADQRMVEVDLDLDAEAARIRPAIRRSASPIATRTGLSTLM